MKKNSLKVLLENCNKGLLADAIMMMSEEDQEGLIDIAMGDIKYYTQESLPIPSYQYIKDLLKELKCWGTALNGMTSIKCIRPENFCKSVRVTVVYDQYYYYKTEEEAKLDKESAGRCGYYSQEYSYKGITPISKDNESAFSIPMDKWIECYEKYYHA